MTISISVLTPPQCRSSCSEPQVPFLGLDPIYLVCLDGKEDPEGKSLLAPTGDRPSTTLCATKVWSAANTH